MMTGRPYLSDFVANADDVERVGAHCDAVSAVRPARTGADRCEDRHRHRDGYDSGEIN